MLEAAFHRLLGIGVTDLDFADRTFPELFQHQLTGVLTLRPLASAHWKQ